VEGARDENWLNAMLPEEQNASLRSESLSGQAIFDESDELRNQQLKKGERGNDRELLKQNFGGVFPVLAEISVSLRLTGGCVRTLVPSRNPYIQSVFLRRPSMNTLLCPLSFAF
jgi:hypothetical protein